MGSQEGKVVVREQDAAELGANTYAQIPNIYDFFLQKFLFLMLMKNMFLFLGISYFYMKSKKEDDLSSASYLHTGHLSQVK